MRRVNVAPGTDAMARLFPPDLAVERIESYAEARTVDTLRRDLPHDWWVVHSCHWTLPRGRGIGQGEIDIVVVSPAGGLALIEQKNGAVEIEGNDYVKHYATRTKSISRQLARNREALLQKFERAGATKPVGVVSVLYFPDAIVTRLQGAALDALTVVDHAEAPHLADRVRTLIEAGAPDPVRVKSILQFFEGEIDLQPSLHALDEASSSARVRLAGPLTQILDGFEMNPMRLRIEASAGSGKSELVLRLAQRAVQRGRHTLVTCFNRPLATLLRAHLPVDVTVDTYLGVCKRLAEALALPVSFPGSVDAAFWDHLQDRLTAALAEHGVPYAWHYDTILVDEAQDLDGQALDRLMQLLRPSGDLVWVGDPEQNLRGESMSSPPGFATFRVLTNYRTPRGIATELGTIAPPGVVFANPVEGTGVQVIASSRTTLAHHVAAEVDRLLAAGYRHADLMVLTLGGLRHLQWADAGVGRHRVMRFTGDYTADGQQIMTEGDLYLDSVARAKGQQRAHVIIAGVDLGQIHATAMGRQLYVALTRATVGASLLHLSDPAPSGSPEETP